MRFAALRGLDLQVQESRPCGAKSLTGRVPRPREAAAGPAPA